MFCNITESDITESDITESEDQSDIVIATPTGCRVSKFLSRKSFGSSYPTESTGGEGVI